MLNRSWFQGFAVIAIFGFLFISAANGYPAQAQKRTFTLIDRLLRANPLRALGDYLRQKLSVQVYYPPQPPPPTHYVRIPAWSPVYYSPTVAMFAPIPTVSPVVQPQSPSVVHGVSYSIPNAVVHQQSVSPYGPPFASPTGDQSHGGYLPVPAQPLTPSTHTQQPIYEQPFVAAAAQPENSFSTGEVSDTGATGTSDNVRVIVISDKIKDLSNISPEFLKDYNMKYIDLDRDVTDQLLRLASKDDIQEEGNIYTHQNRNCSAPMVCDPFLKTLFPTLRASPTEKEVYSVEEPPHISNATMLDLSGQQSGQGVTVVKAIETTVDDFVIPKPKTNKTPRTHQSNNKRPRKLLSAKIRSTSLKKHEPRQKSLPFGSITNKVHHQVHALTHGHLVKAVEDVNSDTMRNQFSPSASEAMNSASRFDADMYYPSFRYGTGGRHKMGKSTKTTSAHYTAGVLFNNAQRRI